MSNKSWLVFLTCKEWSASVTPACFSTEQMAKGSADDTSLQGGWVGGALCMYKMEQASSAEATGVCGTGGFCWGNRCMCVCILFTAGPSCLSLWVVFSLRPQGRLQLLLAQCEGCAGSPWHHIPTLLRGERSSSLGANTRDSPDRGGGGTAQQSLTLWPETAAGPGALRSLMWRFQCPHPQGSAGIIITQSFSVLLNCRMFYSDWFLHSQFHQLYIKYSRNYPKLLTYW